MHRQQPPHNVRLIFSWHRPNEKKNFSFYARHNVNGDDMELLHNFSRRAAVA